MTKNRETHGKTVRVGRSVTCTSHENQENYSALVVSLNSAPVCPFAASSRSQ